MCTTRPSRIFCRPQPPRMQPSSASLFRKRPLVRSEAATTYAPEVALDEEAVPRGRGPGRTPLRLGSLLGGRVGAAVLRVGRLGHRVRSGHLASVGAMGVCFVGILRPEKLTEACAGREEMTAVGPGRTGLERPAVASGVQDMRPPSTLSSPQGSTVVTRNSRDRKLGPFMSFFVRSHAHTQTSPHRARYRPDATSPPGIPPTRTRSLTHAPSSCRPRRLPRSPSPQPPHCPHPPPS